MVKNRGGLTFIRKYTIQTQKHLDNSDQNRSSFFASLKSLTPHFLLKFDDRLKNFSQKITVLEQKFTTCNT